MSGEEIAKQISDFLAKGGKIQHIERGMSATDMVGGPFNGGKVQRNRTKTGGLGITIKGERK